MGKAQRAHHCNGGHSQLSLAFAHPTQDLQVREVYMHYHFFIHSLPHTEKSLAALQFAREVLAQGDEINQVFFYAQGVGHAAEAALAAQWCSLRLPPQTLKVCQSYAERYTVSLLRSEFILAGLIDFFATHWQDQGTLVQF